MSVVRVGNDAMERRDGDRPRNGMIDSITLLRAFVAVVELQSFTGAGRRLNVVPSTISKHIAALEQQLAGQLLIRSTKTLSVTELGMRLYHRCLAILSEVEEAESEVSEYNSEPQGLLRISAPTTLMTNLMAPMIFSFRRRYPKVSLELSLTPVNEDLVALGIDVAVRISHSLDPSLVALKLARNMRRYCASPDYLKARGVPTTVADLKSHDCIAVRGTNQSVHWSFRQPNGAMEMHSVHPSLSADNSEFVRQAVRAGLGIGQLAYYLVEDDLQSGRLIELFPDSCDIESNIYVVYPNRRNLALKTRAFIDHLKESFKAREAEA